MRPQTLGIDQLIQIEGTVTFLVQASILEHGELYVPTLFVEGIGEGRMKFDFYRAYKNNEDVVLHCEYRSTTTKHKLIVHTQ